MRPTQLHELDAWARSLEESNAGVDPQTGKPLVSATEWRRLDEHADIKRGSLARRMWNSMLGKLT